MNSIKKSSYVIRIESFFHRRVIRIESFFRFETCFYNNRDTFNKNHFDRKNVNILIIIDRLIKMIKYTFINKIDVIFTARVFYL